ncbi:MAG: hypothetical protein ACRCX2_35160, partial [Paraclostridium sp.]
VLSNAMPEIQEGLKKFGITMMIIQQVRTGFNRAMQAYDKRSGGNALAFAPSTVLKIANQSADNEVGADGLVDTRYVRYKNEKSKVSRPYTTTHSYINVNPDKKIAIHRRRECMDYAIEYGIISSGGAWVYVDVINEETGEVETLKFNGKARAMAAFDDDLDLYSTTKLKVYVKGLPPELFITKYDEIVTMLENENSTMKENKINTLKTVNKLHLANKRDTHKYTIDKKIYSIEGLYDMLYPEVDKDFLEENPNYKTGKQIMEMARFNLMSLDEQKEFLAKKDKEEKAKKIELVVSND